MTTEDPALDAGTRRELADELLAIRCQLGEPGAMDALVERWHPSLWRYVRGLASDDDAAAEAVQDVWLRVLRAISRLRDPARLRAWLFGIARRVMMDRLRQAYAEAQRAEIDLEEIPGPTTPRIATRTSRRCTMRWRRCRSPSGRPSCSST